MQIPDGYWSEDPSDPYGALPYICLKCQSTFSPWWDLYKEGDARNFDTVYLCDVCWLWFHNTWGTWTIAHKTTPMDAVRAILECLEKS